MRKRKVGVGGDIEIVWLQWNQFNHRVDFKKLGKIKWSTLDGIISVVQHDENISATSGRDHRVYIYFL